VLARRGAPSSAVGVFVEDNADAAKRCSRTYVAWCPLVGWGSPLKNADAARRSVARVAWCRFFSVLHNADAARRSGARVAWCRFFLQNADAARRSGARAAWCPFVGWGSPLKKTQTRQRLRDGHDGLSRLGRVLPSVGSVGADGVALGWLGRRWR
jgi:hypothetical protein